ncbi:hypothetical protein HK102_001918, partial [Quaeritorhiza haematococci]
DIIDEDTNDAYRGFINNSCEPVAMEDESGWIPVAEFYQRFKTWYHENGFAEDAKLHENQIAKKFSGLVNRRNMNKAAFKGNHIRGLRFRIECFEVITKDNGDLIDLVDFLKLKLSSEDQQLFVDSFALYMSSKDEFCVDLDLAVQWLHVPRKQQLVEKLGDSAAFTKGVDYKVFTSKPENLMSFHP